MPVSVWLDLLLLLLVVVAGSLQRPGDPPHSQPLAAGCGVAAVALRLAGPDPPAAHVARTRRRLTGLLVFLPLYMLRGMAAGDVKLMATVGLPSCRAGEAFEVAVMTVCAGGVMALVVVVWNRRLRDAGANVLSLLRPSDEFGRRARWPPNRCPNPAWAACRTAWPSPAPPCSSWRSATVEFVDSFLATGQKDLADVLARISSMLSGNIRLPGDPMFEAAPTPRHHASPGVDPRRRAGGDIEAIVPPQPSTLRDTGLERQLVLALLAKTIAQVGKTHLHVLGSKLRLSINVLREALDADDGRATGGSGAPRRLRHRHRNTS